MLLRANFLAKTILHFHLLTSSISKLQVFFIIPCLDIYQKIDMRTATYDVPPQEVKESWLPPDHNALYFFSSKMRRSTSGRPHKTSPQRRCPSLKVPKIALPSLYSRLMRWGVLSMEDPLTLHLIQSIHHSYV